MKKRILAAVMLAAAVLAGLWLRYDRLPGGYSRGQILGRTPQQIQQRYGAFTHTFYSTEGVPGMGVYLVREDGPELIMGYDDSLWLVVDFEQGVASRVYTREGYLGG